MYNILLLPLKKKIKFLLTRISIINELITDVKLCWLAFMFTFLNESYIIMSNIWFDSINSSFIFPSGPNPMLVFIFLTWIYVWGISNLRRTLFGKFTRGDRKLWFKSFASFWIVELVTIGGLYIAACWMSWGPAPVIHRNFLIPTKSFLVELSLFTFIIWALYLLRFFIKWNSWKTSSIITVFIILITSWLIWRDLVLFWGRETISINNSARWRYIDPHITRYSLCPEWWNSNYIGNDKFLSSNLSILELLNSYNIIPTSTEYEKFNLLPELSFEQWFNNSIPYASFFKTDLFNSFNSTQVFSSISATVDYTSFDFMNRSLNNAIIYPRRIGFSTKKLAMWTLFIILKMWHHVILFYWWFLFLLRLYGTRKNAYSLLSTCGFNVYCCFVIGLIVYIFYLLPFYENFLRLKPFKIRGILYRRSTYSESILYVIDLFTFERRSFKFHLRETLNAFTRTIKGSIKNDFFFNTLIFSQNVYLNDFKLIHENKFYPSWDTLKHVVIWPELYILAPLNYQLKYPLSSEDFFLSFYQSDLNFYNETLSISEELLNERLSASIEKSEWTRNALWTSRHLHPKTGFENTKEIVDIFENNFEIELDKCQKYAEMHW